MAIDLYVFLVLVKHFKEYIAENCLRYLMKVETLYTYYEY